MTSNVERELERYLANARKLEAAHAYSPADEHDACGVGLVAAVDGKPRREVVVNAINALKCVWHRGAVDADGKTGDGAGLHIQGVHGCAAVHCRQAGAIAEVREDDPAL